MLNAEAVHSFRSKTFRIIAGSRVRTPEEAAQFVNERGFVFFWPITGITLPSLWAAVAGDRPVADAHDDPGHITWGWKDEHLGGRLWYYAKVLRKKATLISFEAVPYFYALSENYGSPEEDYLMLYEQGRLTLEAKMIYEALLDHGVLDTVELRRVTRMTSKGSDSRFERALSDLQADFKIVPVRVTESGAWWYAFAFDIVARHYPELPEQAHVIQERQARKELARWYLNSVGAAQARDLVRLFSWKPAVVSRLLDSLVEEGVVVGGQIWENQPGEWFALPALVG